MINGLVGVILWTNDAGKLAHFYKEMLGLKVHSDHGNFVSFKWDGIRLGIGTHSEVIGNNKQPKRIMVNFGVSDIHSESKRLQSQGVKFIRQPEKETWGGWICTFSDPEGNILQLLQMPDQD